MTWSAQPLDKFVLPRATLFVVRCDAEFPRRVGARVLIDGKLWEVLGWDDHRMHGSPRDGETIGLRVREVPE